MHLCEVHQELQHVRQALPGDGAGGNHVDILALVGVLPVQGHVQALLVQVQHGLPQALVELAPDVLLLAVEGLLDGRVCLGLPVEQAVNLQREKDTSNATYGHRVWQWKQSWGTNVQSM